MKERTWLGILLSFAAPCRGKMAASVLFAICSVAGGFVPYLGVYQIIRLFLERRADWEGILFWCGVCLAGYAVKVAGYALSTTLAHVSAYTILEGLRLRAADQLMGAPLGEVESRPIGAMKSTIVDRIEDVEPPLAHMIPELSSNLLLPLVVVIAMFSIDWRMGLALLVTIPVALIPMAFGMRSYNKNYAAYMAANAHVNSVIVEYVEGIQVVKAFSQGQRSYEKFARAVSSFKDFTMDWFRCTWASMNLCLSILPTTLLGTLPAGVALYQAEVLDPAQVTLCLMMALGIVTPLMSATSFINSMKSMQFAVKDTRRLLDLPQLPQAEREVPLEDHTIRFQDVSFSYGGVQGAEVFHHLDLTIPQGKFTALVGPSGGGKSTIARLAARFWDVTGGSITLGGRDIRELPLKELSGQISFVTQDNFLFDCSLKENIRLGKPGASDEEVFAAARAAQCEEFIGRRGGKAALRRGATAHRHRPGDSEGRPHRDFGRGHGIHRPRERGADPALPQGSVPGKDFAGDCPPALHHSKRGPDCGAGEGPHRGSRDTAGAALPLHPLPGPLVGPCGGAELGGHFPRKGGRVRCFIV